MKRSRFHVVRKLHGVVSLDEVYGWTDGQYGYYKDDTYDIVRWYAVDLRSGLSVHELYAHTLKEAADLATKNESRIREFRESPKYQESLATYALLQAQQPNVEC